MTKPKPKTKPLIPGVTTVPPPPPPDTCVDGKAHNYRQSSMGSYGKGYYEHLRVEEVEETYTEYPQKDDGNYDYSKPIKKTRKVTTTVDDEPGHHYSTVYCSKCGEAKEILVKSHGPKYAEGMLKLNDKQRRELLSNGKTNA